MVTPKTNIPAAAHSSHILDMYREEYDYPVFDEHPALEYMIASIPRTGSTHLAVELWRTGVMGAPMEYPNVPFRRFMQQRFGTGDDVLSYWQDVHRVRTSPNGVFGFKLFVSDYRSFAANHPEILPLIAPAKVIYLTRTDLVAQAVSYSRAIRSNRWFHDVREWQHPEYDVQHIQASLDLIHDQMRFWEEVFALTQTQVHRVTYEQLSENLNDVVSGVAAFLDVPLDSDATLALPRMHIQRDAKSAEWAHRFKKEPSIDEIPGRTPRITAFPAQRGAI